MLWAAGQSTCSLPLQGSSMFRLRVWVLLGTCAGRWGQQGGWKPSCHPAAKVIQDYQHPGVCLLQPEGAGAPGRVQGFRGAGLKALAGMAKHSALKPTHPYSPGRTHRLHDGELSAPNTPLPVGNPNAASHGWSVPTPQTLTLPAGAGCVCRGTQACFPAACLRGRLGLPAGSPALQTHPVSGGCPRVPRSTSSRTVLCGSHNFRRLPSSLPLCCPFGCSFCRL